MSTYGTFSSYTIKELRNIIKIYKLGGIYSRATKDELIRYIMSELFYNVDVEPDEEEPQMSVRVRRIKESNK
jgi:hypothetical protein